MQLLQLDQDIVIPNLFFNRHVICFRQKTANESPGRSSWRLSGYITKPKAAVKKHHYSDKSASTSRKIRTSFPATSPPPSMGSLPHRIPKSSRLTVVVPENPTVISSP